MGLVAGDFVDRYRIVSRLGAGGMGEVFRAHDTRLQRDVALKILHPDPSSGSGSATGGAARLLREARSVAALEHPNVITIHDVGEIAEPASLVGTPYIAMELIKGRSLREYMTAAPVPLSERVGWLVGAALGLAAAHKVGLVHRDVKPENIMVRDDGVVKVLDFGIAKRSYPTGSVDPTSSTEAQLLPHLSTQGVVVGTPYYMAPEQMRNEPLDGRADQFSWAVVAYELLAGKPPWTMGGDALQLVSEILSRQPPLPHVLNAEISEQLEAVLVRALAKSRDDRFPSMSAVVDALLPAGAASLRSLPPQTSPFARTESIAPSVPSAGALPSGGFVPSATTPQPTPAQPPIVPAAPGTAKVASRARWAQGALALATVAIVAAAAVASRHRASPGAAISGASPAASIADDPALGSTVPAAVSAYRAAMSALRDADVERAKRELDEALRADPRFAAAQLRRGIAHVPLDEEGRGHLVDAMRMRATLGGHDQALLGALAPLSTTPGDLVEAEKRLSEVATRSPDDVDFAVQLCNVRGALEREDAVGACRRASELDPGAAAPLRTLAVEQARAGDVRGALASFDACLRAFPLATACLVPLAQLQALEGECDAALASARRLIAADPESPQPYDALAEALLGADQPIEGVRAALDDEHARTRPDELAVVKAQDEATLAIRFGDFGRADAQLRVWDEALASSRQERDHFLVSAYRVLLAVEQGRVKDAEALATAYLARRSAWSTDDDESFFFDGVLYRIGAIARPELARRREAWIATKKAEPRAPRLGFLWIAAYAEPAVTADDGREALGVLPSYLPLPGPFMRAPDFELPIGNAYRLAGRDAEAIPYLRRAAKACVGREAPFEQTWASFALGEALEKEGDTAGACEAYAVVRRRWRRATGSVTERRAEARIAALACGR